MNCSHTLLVLLLIGVLTMPAGSAPAASPDAQITSIRATADRLEVNTNGPGRRVALIEFQVYQAGPEEGQVIWSGVAPEGAISLPRFNGKQDRLYSKLQLAQPDTLEPIAPPHWVNDLSGIEARDFEMPWPESKKGVTCPVDDADLIATGTDYMDTNIMVPAVIDRNSENPEETWEVDGRTFGINMDYIRRFDAQFKRMNEAGINVTLILLNPVPTKPDPGNPFIHPRTDLAGAPNHLGAFNLTDKEGLLHYRAAVEYLVNRYSDPTGEHGWVSGYVVGNELQSHWYWHNTGHIDADEIIRDYANQLRVAWLAVRRCHAKVRVYVSLDHCWTMPVHADPQMAIPGRTFLEGLNSTVRSEGNFPWHVAFHPYPSNLFEPRFWLDKEAVFGFDTPKITFRNLEVLPAFLRQEEFLIDGAPRRIILSEQGFHCPDGPGGEEAQAAAYALAYYKVRHMDEIDSFILHRHVDHRGEGGLRLGLWSCKQDGDNPCAPDRARLIHEVYRRADTDQWEQAFEFAKSIVGIEDWSEALPRTEPIPEDSGQFARPVPAELLILDLHASRGTAKTSDCLDWRATFETGADGRSYPALFHHPRGGEEPPARATYRVALPDLPEGSRIVLEFGTRLTGDSEDGVEYAVLVGEEKVWSLKVTQAHQPTHHEVDLSRFAGGEVDLTLEVGAVGNATHDWATWLRPVIRLDRGE